MYVQRGIRTDKLRQISVGVFLCIDTGVSLFGDAIYANQLLGLAEIKGC